MTGPVCVVGSLNEDTTLVVATLPAPGETTLTRTGRRLAPGGKGANQAAAAAVLGRAAGVAVTMVGAVGDDGAGRRSLDALVEVGVATDQVTELSEAGTGVAVITVDAGGENTIVVDPGANARLDADAVAAAVRAVAPGVVLVQLEVPVTAVEAALRAAPDAVRVLNPAPLVDAEPVRRLLPLVDVLVPNRGELGRLAGRPEPTSTLEVAACVAALGFVGDVVVTLGSGGALHVAPGAEPVLVPGVQVDTVDASGAGDVFCGSLAAGLAAGDPLAEVVERSNAAAARSTTRPGARLPADAV